jgi:CubicO group peptidase (beta-lactamase class C family)
LRKAAQANSVQAKRQWAFDEASIDEIFSGLDQTRLPGAAVGIAHEGRPQYRKAFGLANMELPIALTPATRMRIYSTTKHFTCLAFLLFAEDGRATLSDTIGTYLPELNPALHSVTVEQLMTHTSGIRDARDLCMQFDRGYPASSEEQLRYYRSLHDFNFAPGTAFSYCNGGFTLLSAIIEKLAGKPLEDVFRERIFEPAGMYDSLLRRTDTGFVRNSAALHAVSPGGGFDKSNVGLAVAGEGGIVSTVDDMLRWLAQMEFPLVGTSRSWSAMRRPRRVGSGFSTGYGLGLATEPYRGLTTIGHAGGSMGANSQMIKVPELKLDIIVMVNRGDVSSIKLTEQILDACVTGLDPTGEDGAEEEHGPKGVYWSPSTHRVIELGDSSRWYPGETIIASIDGMDLPVRFAGSKRLLPKAESSADHFAIDIEGDPSSPAALKWHDYGAVTELEQVLPPDEADPQKAGGCFTSGSVGVTASIEQQRDGLVMSVKGRFGSSRFTLRPLGRYIWRAETDGPLALGGTIVFNPDFQAFTFSNFARTRDLVFDRAQRS